MAGYGETSKGVSHMQNHTGISPIVFIYTSIMDVPWGRSVPKAAEFFKKGMETWKLKCLKKSISRNVTLVAEVDHGGQVYCVLRTYTHARSRPSRRTRKLVFVAYYMRFWTVQPGAEHADSKQFFILIGSLPRLKCVSVGGRLSGLRS